MRPLARHKGQLSLIMLFLVAIAFILYAVSMNWSRIAGVKTLVTVASNKAASRLVSQMAGYGEQLLQTQLGGVVHKCDNSGVMMAIVAFIVIIVILVVCAVTSQFAEGAALAAFMWPMIIAASLSAVAVVVQATLVQPALTRAWNKWQQGLKTTEDRFLEGGIQEALTASVSDNVQVDDRWDMDMNGRWYNPAAPAALRGTYGEKISRFSYWYTDRMKNVSLPKPNNIPELQKALKAIEVDLGIYTDRSDDNLTDQCYYDPPDNTKPRPECNRCCSGKTVRPSSCDPLETQEAKKNKITPIWKNYPDVSNGCPAFTGCVKTQPTTCNVYDPMYPLRGSDSTVLNVLGLDDGDIHSYLDSSNVTKIDPKASTAPANYGIFRGKDSVGKMFPLFWLMADTATKTYGLDTTGLNPQNLATGTPVPKCHWFSMKTTLLGGQLLGSCVNETTDINSRAALFRPAGSGYDQLDRACNGVDCYINRFLDDRNNPDSRQMDKVDSIPAFDPVLDTACAPWDSNITTQLWKKGSDRYQDTFNAGTSTYPIKMNDYNQNGAPLTLPNPQPLDQCADTNIYDNINKQCNCSTADAALRPTLWRDDQFDTMAAEMAVFKQIADRVLGATSADERSALAYNTDGWLDALSDQVAVLRGWQARMTLWKDAIDKWENANASTTAGYASYTGGDLWCLPANPGDVSATEQSAIVAGTAWGSLQSVVQCLNYNVSNSTKFAACAQNCSYSNVACRQATDLPRSLVQGFNPNSILDVQRFDPGISCRINSDPTTQDICEKLCLGTWAPNPTLINVPCSWDNAKGCFNFMADPKVWFTAADGCSALYTNKADCTTRQISYLWPGRCNGHNCKNINTTNCSLTGTQAACNDYISANLSTGQYCLIWDNSGSLGACKTTFKNNISASMTLAQNQDPKFQKRYDYLKDLRNKAQEIRTALNDALTQMPAHLDKLEAAIAKVRGDDCNYGCAYTDASGNLTEHCQKICMAIKGSTSCSAADFKASCTQTTLGNEVIYGWYSPRPQSWGSDVSRQKGYLHIVKIQAATPKRGSVDGSDPKGLPTCTFRLPWVHTYTKGFLGTTRCYDLSHNSGCVGVRVIRYDEDHDPQAKGIFKFLSGLPLWQIIYHNPKADIPQNINAGNNPVEAVRSFCMDRHYSRRPSPIDPNDPSQGYRYEYVVLTQGSEGSDLPGDLADAFMLNLPLDYKINNVNGLDTCRQASEELLKRGVFSETCARYTAGSGFMQMKFKACTVKDCCSQPQDFLGWVYGN